MKRILMLMLFVMATMVANAQYRNGQVLVCTGDNVNVRKGPGKNYGVVYNGCSLSYDQLFKGEEVKYAGKTRNGFIYVNYNSGSTIGCSEKAYGWVSNQYLKSRNTRKCPACNGKGYFNRPCKDYSGDPVGHPHVYNCQIYDDGYGKQHCHKCNGKGYL